MYLRRKDAKDLIEQLFATSHEEIRKKNKFLGELVRLDDWSFIIKSHALIEAAVSQALTDHVGAPLLTDFFQRLPLSDGQIGKSKLAKQLGLLDSKELKFIRWFSELRNKLVHRIDNLEFDIKQHISGLGKEQKDSYIKTWLWFSEGDLQAYKEWEEIAEKSPKITIYVSVFQILTTCILSSLNSNGKRKIDELTEATMESIFNTGAGAGPDTEGSDGTGY